MKYQCIDCGEVFDYCDAKLQKSWGGAELDICPKCESEDLIEDYKEPEPEEERELTADDKAELRCEWLMECERNGD